MTKMQNFDPAQNIEAGAYLQGSSDVMALALSKLSGLPLGVWAGHWRAEGASRHEYAHPVVVLDHEKGLWADLRGIQAGIPGDLRFNRPVDGIDLLPATEYDIRTGFSLGGIGQMELERAVDFAKDFAPVRELLDRFKIAGGVRHAAPADEPVLGPASPAFQRWFDGSKIVGPDGTPLPVYHGTQGDFSVFQSMAPVTVYLLDGEEIQRADTWDVDANWDNLPEAYHYGAVVDAMTLGPEEALRFRERESARYQSAGLDPDTVRRLRDLRRMQGHTITQLTETRPSGDGYYFTPDLGYSFIRDAGNRAGGNVIPVYLSIKNPVFLNASQIEGAGAAFNVEKYRALGYDGAVFADYENDLTRRGWNGATQIVAFQATQIKSALGNRGTYSPTDPDIRFSRTAMTRLAPEAPDVAATAPGKRRTVVVPQSVIANLQPVSVAEALAQVSGKTEKPGGVDPATWVREDLNPATQLLGRVPLSAFVENEEGDLYDGTVNRDRAMAYAKRSAAEAPPVIAVIGRHSGMLHILDGGHRLSAARLRADAGIEVILRIPAGTELVFEAPELDSPEGNEDRATPVESGQASIEPAPSLTVEAVHAALAEDGYAHHVDVYATFADVPAAIRKKARIESDAGVEGFWDSRRNRVALVAEFLSSPERVRQVARHELVGHYGLETMLGRQGMAEVTAMVITAEAAGNTVVQSFGTRVDVQQPGLTPPRRAMEIVALMAEDNLHNTPIMRRVADGMRVFLRRVGFIQSDVTDLRLCGLLRDSQRYLKRQQKVAARAERSASVDPLSPNVGRVFYGTISGKQSDAVLLESLGVQLGEYDSASGRFHVRFKDAAREALKEFSADFVVQAIEVPRSAEAQAYSRRDEREPDWLAARRAVLTWAQKGGELARVAGWEPESARLELAAVDAGLRRAQRNGSTAGQHVAPVGLEC